MQIEDRADKYIDNAANVGKFLKGNSVRINSIAGCTLKPVRLVVQFQQRDARVQKLWHNPPQIVSGFFCGGDFGPVRLRLKRGWGGLSTDP